MGNKIKDLTVLEASDILGVSTRSVINYINAKELDAIKVGKAWYIRLASLDSFSKRFKFIETKTEDKKYSVKNLKLFQRAKEILSNGKLENFTHEDEQINKRLKELRLSAFELIGAGYYTYGALKKMNIYNSSREKVGGIIGILLSYPQNEELEQIIDEIEGELLPAYSALIKRMDKDSGNFKNLQ